MIFTSGSIDLKRVVVTGLGIISSVGKSVPESWENVKNGIGGVGMITHFDPTDYYSKIAGEVKDYDPLDYFDRKEAKKTDPYIQFALISAEEAVKDSGFVNAPGADPTRHGVYIGSGIGGISTVAPSWVTATLTRCSSTLTRTSTHPDRVWSITFAASSVTTNSTSAAVVGPSAVPARVRSQTPSWARTSERPR